MIVDGTDSPWAICVRFANAVAPGRPGTRAAASVTPRDQIDYREVLNEGDFAVFARNLGLTVPIAGHDTTGVAVCNQVRTFDIEACIRAGTARDIETPDGATTDEIVSRVPSVIDPEGA